MVTDIVFVLAALAAAYVPVGNYMARVSTPTPMIQVLNGPSTASPALIRGFIATKKDGRIGNFRVDLTRTVFRILLPAAVIGALILISQGAIQNFHAPQTITTLTGATRTNTHRRCYVCANTESSQTPARDTTGVT